MSSSNSPPNFKWQTAAIKNAIRDPRQLGLDARPAGQARWMSDHPPACGQRKKSTLSIISRPDTLTFRCHACGFSGDTFDLLAEQHGLDVARDFKEVLQIAERIAGTDYTSPAMAHVAAVVVEDTPVDTEAIATVAALLSEACPMGGDVLEYLQGRGFEKDWLPTNWAALPKSLDEQAQVARSIVDEIGKEKWIAGGVSMPDGSAGFSYSDHRLVIPWDSESFNVVAIQRRTVEDIEKWRWRKYVFGRGRNTAAPSGFAEFLEMESEQVWICEGALDALAIRAMSDHGRDRSAIGIPGKGVWKAEWSQALAGKDITIALDRDGDDEAAKIAEHLSGVGVRSCTRSIPESGDWASNLPQHEEGAA